MRAGLKTMRLIEAEAAPKIPFETLIPGDQEDMIRYLKRIAAEKLEIDGEPEVKIIGYRFVDIPEGMASEYMDQLLDSDTYGKIVTVAIRNEWE